MSEQINKNMGSLPSGQGIPSHNNSVHNVKPMSSPKSVLPIKGYEVNPLSRQSMPKGVLPSQGHSQPGAYKKEFNILPGK